MSNLLRPTALVASSLLLISFLSAGCGGGGSASNTQAADTASRSDISPSPTPTATPFVPVLPPGSPGTEVVPIQTEPTPFPASEGSIPPAKRIVVVNGQSYIADRITVNFRSGVPRTTVDRVLAEHGLGFLFHSGAVGYYVVSVPETKDVFEVERELEIVPEVDYVTVDTIGGGI